MTAEINTYEGAGYVPGSPAGGRKKTSAQSIRETHRKVVKAFQDIGFQALNAADYERTMMLPVGRGRLACDETGEFDPYAPRPGYVASQHGTYPRHVHSTITDGEFLVVNDATAHLAALNTHKWADKPIERKKRFTLTPDDQMQNLKAQIESERAARLYQEKEFEARMSNVPVPVPALSAAAESDILRLELQQERDQRQALEARVNALLARFEDAPVAAAVSAVIEEEPEDEQDEDEEAEEAVAPVVKRGRR